MANVKPWAGVIGEQRVQKGAWAKRGRGRKMEKEKRA
jgi:hypothetical protein